MDKLKIQLTNLQECSREIFEISHGESELEGLEVLSLSDSEYRSITSTVLEMIFVC